MSKELELLRKLVDILKQQEPVVSHAPADAFVALGRYTQVAVQAKQLIEEGEKGE